MRNSPRLQRLAGGLGDATNGVAQPDGVLVPGAALVAQPAPLCGLALAEEAHDPRRGAIHTRSPEAEGLAGEEVPAADDAHRHRRDIVGLAPDGQYPKNP